jgi:hypothetical protein
MEARATNKMQVNMGDFLSAIPPYPKEQFIPFFGNIQVSRHIAGNKHQFPREERIARRKIVYRRNLSLRNDQYMHRRKRMNISKR